MLNWLSGKQAPGILLEDYGETEMALHLSQYLSISYVKQFFSISASSHS